MGACVSKQTGAELFDGPGGPQQQQLKPAPPPAPPPAPTLEQCLEAQLPGAGMSPSQAMHKVLATSRAIMQDLATISSPGAWSTCCAAAKVLQKHLHGVATVSIAAHTTASHASLLAGVHGPGAEVLQRTMVRVGPSWSSSACRSREGQHCYYTVPPGHQPEPDLPQDFAALHDEANLRTFMAVNVTGFDGQQLGVLALASTQPRAFQEEWWPAQLDMICSSLVPLLMSPCLRGLCRLAGKLLDCRHDFAAFAQAYIDGASALLQSVTQLELTVRLGLLSADAQEVLVLHNSPNTRPPICSCGQAPDACTCGSTLGATRVPAAGSLLLEAVQGKTTRVVRNITDAFIEGSLGPAPDMFAGCAEPAHSIVVVPLLQGPAAPGPCEAYGGVLITHGKQGGFAQGKAKILNVTSLLQSMLQLQLASVPADWGPLLQALAPPWSGGIHGSSSSASISSSASSRSFSSSLVHMLQQEVQQCLDSGKGASAHVCFDNVALLGKGAFGLVLKATWQGCPVAVKLMKTPEHTRAAVKAAREMAAMTCVSHANIVRTYSCFTDMCMVKADGLSTLAANLCFRPAQPEDFANGCLFDVLIMERCRVNLNQALQRGLLHPMPRASHEDDGPCAGPGALVSGGQAPCVNLPLLLSVLLDVAHSLEHLHSVNIVHCDLKGGNVLLQSTSERPCGFICKLADFGLSKILDDRGLLRNNSLSGTLSHLAPERYLSNTLLTPAVDTYSLAILAVEAYTGRPAFAGLPPGVIMQKVLQGWRPVLPDCTPSDFRRLVEACWATDPAQRPSMTEAAQQLQAMLERCSSSAAAAPAQQPSGEAA